MINKNISYPSLFSSLSDQLNRNRPLYQLGYKINRQRFEDTFSPLYNSDTGRKSKPIRLMCDLLILKHVRNLSDESVVEIWSENAYYQYFCRMEEFSPSFPCNATETVHFHKRIGEKRLELIPAESNRVNGKNDNRDHYDIAFRFYSTGKDCYFSHTDAELHKKILCKVLSIVKKLNLSLRRSYTFTIDSYYTRKKKHTLFCKRVYIEPTTGHLKSNFRIGRNFYKGVFGDSVNVLLAAVVYNFRKKHGNSFVLYEKISEILFYNNISPKYTFKD